MSERTLTAWQISRSRHEATEWLESADDGYPRSWSQEDRDALRRGYSFYDPEYGEAPTIAGYEALERDGLVERIGLVEVRGQERVHFRATEKFRRPATPENG